MTKTLCMVSYKNYNLNAKRGFCHFLTFKLITCFIDGFTLRRKSQSIAYYSMKVNIYIGFWTLKPKCTKYGLYGRATFKNVRVWAAQGRGTEALAFSVLPLPACSDTCNARRGFLENPPVLVVAYNAQVAFTHSLTLTDMPTSVTPTIYLFRFHIEGHFTHETEGPFPLDCKSPSYTIFFCNVFIFTLQRNLNFQESY